MANFAPSKTDDLDKVIKQLFDIYSSVSLQRNRVESICDDCRRLLKPWPNRKQNAVKGNEMVVDKCQVPVAMPAVTNSCERSTDNADGYSYKELEAVEKALAKAEKTRQRFKMKVDSNLDELGKSSSITNSAKALSTHDKPHEFLDSSSDVQQHIFDSATDSLSASQQSSNESRPDSNLTINSTSLNGNINKNKYSPYSEPSVVKNNYLSGKRGPTVMSAKKGSNMPYKVTSESSAVISKSSLNQLLSSSASAASSSTTTSWKARTAKYMTASQPPQVSSKSVGKKYVPAHVSAPFKTVPQVYKNKKKSSSKTTLLSSEVAAVTDGTDCSDLLSVSGKINRQDGGVDNKAMTKQLDRRNACVSEFADYYKEDDKEKCESLDILACSVGISASNDRINESRNFFPSTNEEVFQHTSLETNQPLVINVKTVADVSKGMPARDYDNETCPPITDLVSSMSNNIEGRFNLLKHGHQLSLPHQLQRILANRRRLRERLRKSTSSQNKFNQQPQRVQFVQSSHLREDTQAADQFLKRLQSHMYDQPNGFQHSQSLDIKQLCDVYDWFADMLDNVSRSTISESSSLESVLDAHARISFVLREFSELEDSFKLCMNDDAYNNEDEDVDISQLIKSLEITHELRSMRPFFSWLPPEICSDIPSASCMRMLNYTRHSQLVRYSTLVFNAQQLQLQNHILRIAGPALIRLLNELDPNDQPFCDAYRAAYSLVCSFGRTFPTIIKDVPE